MRAATLVGRGVVEVGDFEPPTAGPDEVLVAMSHASICGSDVHTVFDGHHQPELLGRPGYPGHEGVGIVVEDARGDVGVGTQVLTVPVGTRGFCFAEFQSVPVGQLVGLPDGDPRPLLMAQQLGTTVFALKKFLPGVSVERSLLGGENSGTAPIVPTSLPASLPTTVAVIGAGSAGLFFTQLLKALGVETVLVSDLNADRVARARRLGADVAVHEPAESLLAAVHDLTAGAGAELVIEAAGYERTRELALAAVRVQGRAGMFGHPEARGLAPFPVHEAFRKSVSVDWVSGTQSEPGLASFRTAVRLIDHGRLDVSHCLEIGYPLEETPTAMTVAREHGHGAAKITLEMPDQPGVSR